MNWEAFFVIGAFTVILALVLLVPGLMWARSQAKQHSEAPAGMSITRIGFLYLGTMVAVLLVGFSSQYWAPQSWLGQWTATSTGRLLFGAIVVGAGFLFERVLDAAGIRFRVLREKK